MPVHGGPNTIETGLVLSLDANDQNSYPGTGTTWFDLSGNNRNFTLVNSPLYVTSSNRRYFNFDGIDDFATSSIANDNPVKTENFLSKNYTIETWFNLSTLTPRLTDVTEGFQGILVWPGWHAGVFVARSSPTSSAVLVTNNTWNSTRTSDFATVTTLTGSNENLIKTGSWVCVHSIINYSTTQSFTYVNGVNVNTTNQVPASISPSSAGIPANTITIGAARGVSNYRWYVNNGGISSIKLYSIAMTNEEVIQNYNAQKSRFGL